MSETQAGARMRFSTIVAVAAAALLLAGFSPSAYLAGEVVKTALFAAGGVFAALAALFEWTRGGVLRLDRGPLPYALLSVFLVSAASAIATGHLSALGSEFGAESAIFLLGLFLSYELAVHFAASERSTERALLFFAGALGVVLAGEFALFPFVGPAGETLLGDHITFSIAAGFAALLACALGDFFPLKEKARALPWILLPVSLAALLAVPYQPVWPVLVFFAGLFALAAAVRAKKERRYLSLGLAAAALAMSFFGPSVSAALPHLPGADIGEVRPVFTTTERIALEVYGQSWKRMLLGTGPGRFASAWDRYRPEEVNATPFWNIDIDAGSALMPTYAVTLGLLGLFAWLLFYGSLLFEWGRTLFGLWRNRAPKLFASSALVLLGAYGFYWPLVDVPGSVAMVLGAVALGCAVALRGGSVRTVAPPARRSAQRAGAAALVLLAVLWAGWMLLVMLSAIYYARAKSYFAAGDSEEARTLIKIAVALHPSDAELRTQSQIEQESVLAPLFGKQVTPEAAKEARAEAEDSIAIAQRATLLGPGDYLNWLVLGNAQAQQVLLFREDSPSDALQSYTTAAELNPTSPVPLYLRGRFLYSLGRNSEAYEMAQEALALKQDYQDGIKLKQALEAGAAPAAR